MPSLKILREANRANTKTATVDFAAGVVLTIHFCPRMLTPDMLADMEDAAAVAKEAKDNPDAAKDPAFVEKSTRLYKLAEDTILTTVVDWDLLDDDDEKVPITKEGLGGIPFDLIFAIVNAINTDQSVPPVNGADSSSSS